MKTKCSITHNVLIIAEVGSVHDGSFGNSLKLIEMIASCGGNAAKFQTHIASAETLPDAPMPSYFEGEPRYEYFERTSFTLDQWIEIRKKCHDHGLQFISSPFSNEAVELLEKVGVDSYKIPSGEITNTPLLEKVARTGRNVILSSGMSTLRELDQAVSVLRKYNECITILQCTSEYPCPYNKVGLNLLCEFENRYSVPVGLSDHTLTNYASFAAVVLGATVIERHVTFNRNMYGSDARHSLEFDEFADLVSGIRAIEEMLQIKLDKDDVALDMIEMKKIFEKSIVSAKDIQKGVKISEDMLAIKKPGTGIPAYKLNEIIGKCANVFIPKDRLISEEDLS